MEIKILNFIKNNKGMVDADDIADHFNIDIAEAINITRRMLKDRLIYRKNWFLL